MLETNIYKLLSGSYQDHLQKLSKLSQKELENIVLDSWYNSYLSVWADDGESKRLPYIGWFWRHIEFSNIESIPIGKCEDFVGFMANNKWDYPERYLTREEAMQVIKLIDEAIAASREGGLLSDTIEKRDNKLKELWNYMQTLDVPYTYEE